MKKGNFCIILGALLLLAALLLTSYNFWDNYRAGQAADKALEQLGPLIESNSVPIQERKTEETSEPNAEISEVPSEVPSDEILAGEIEYPDYILNPSMDMPVEQVDEKKYIGILSGSSIQRELPVLSDWSTANLKISPCRYSGSAYFDNLIIGAHNYDSHFGFLLNLSYGDTVTFTDIDGNTFNYKAIEIETLTPDSIDELTAGDWDLTLFTCTIGAKNRLIVRFERIGDC